MFRKALLATAALVAGVQFHGAAAAEEAIVQREVVIVLGQGLTRQAQTIQGAEMDLQAAGTSPIKLVDKLPGVSFSSADAFGAYEWAVRINMRGFNQNQLGFTLDGVPLGDMSYGNHNGLHISRALISENLGGVELAQGSGSLDVASTSNLGGTLKFRSRDPQDTFGGTVALTAGSEETLRGFFRLESGEIAGLGTRGYLSYVNSEMDKWKGVGQQNQEQANLKIVQPIGAARLTGWVNWSKRRENDYQDLSLEMINRLGYGWDNISGNWARAVQIADVANNRGDTGLAPTNPAAGTVYPFPINTVDDAYFDAAGLRDDTIGALTLDWPINDAVSINATVYAHQNEGQGIWYTPYLSSPNARTAGATTDNAPISVRTTEYDIDRRGFIGGLTWTLGDHEINAGVWLETNDFNQFRRFYGLNRAAPQRASLNFMSNPFFTQWGYAFETTTTQFHLQDTWDVTDKLTVNFGFKSVNVENAVRTLVINNAPPVAGTNANLVGSIETEDNFLPQIGFTYGWNDQVELFGSYAENIAAYVSAATAGPFSSRSQAVVAEVGRTLNPEESKTWEGGVRLFSDRFQAVAAAYFVQFENRILAVSQGAGIVGNAPVLSNVGAVETVGLEFAGTYDFTDALSVFGSFTYNNSEYQDDVRNRAGAVLAATGGKRVVNTPQTLFKLELNYDDGSWFGSVAQNYTGARFFTFTNEGGRVDDQTLYELTAGYRFSGNALLEGLEAQVNVTNLFDEDYVGTLGTNGFVNSGDSQTLVAGAPRQVFFTLRKTF